MKIDKINIIEIYESFLPDMSGRSVNTNGLSVTDFGYSINAEGNTIIHGILCGSDIDSHGLSNIRWLKDNERAVLHEGIFGLGTDNYTRLSDRVYVDSLGIIYSEPSEGRLVVDNAEWLTEGNSPYIQIHGKYFSPKPNFYMPLVDNLDVFTW